MRSRVAWEVAPACSHSEGMMFGGAWRDLHRPRSITTARYSQRVGKVITLMLEVIERTSGCPPLN